VHISINATLISKHSFVAQTEYTFKGQQIAVAPLRGFGGSG